MQFSSRHEALIVQGYVQGYDNLAIAAVGGSAGELGLESAQLHGVRR